MDLSTRAGRHRQGQRIQAAAEEAGLPLAELAKQVGCSRALIYQYLSGQVLAQPDRLQAIANLCGRSLAWFYCDEGETLPAAERDEELDRVRAELESEKLAFERARAGELAEHLTALAGAQGAPPDFAALRRTCERLVERARDLDDPVKLAEAWFRLGNACYALGDYDAVRAAMTTAADSFRALDQPARERAARQTLGAALAGLGERDRALSQFAEVLAGGSFADEWRARLGRADVFEALGRGEEALAELQAAEARIVDEPESTERSWAELYVTAATVNVYLLHDDFEAALSRARECVRKAEELAEVGQLIEARINVGFARRQLGQWAESWEAFDDAVRLARLTADQERAATALACRAELLACLGLHDRARAEGKDALAAALAMGSARGELLAHLALSEAYRRSGHGQEALYHAKQGLAAAAGHSLTKLEARLRVAVAMAKRALGEVGAAAEERRALATAESVGARWVQGLAAWSLAAEALAQGDLGAAREQLAVAERLADQTGEWELLARVRWRAAEVAAAEGDATAAVAAAAAGCAALLTLREGLLEQGVEEALLEEPERLTALAAYATLLAAAEAPDAVAALLQRAAWPPLDDTLGGRE